MEKKDEILPEEGLNLEKALIAGGALGLLALTKGKFGYKRAVKALASEVPNKLTFKSFAGVPVKEYSFYGGGKVPSMIEAARRGSFNAIKRKSLFDNQYKVQRISQPTVKAAKNFIEQGQYVLRDATKTDVQKKKILKEMFNEVDSRILEDAAHYVERTGKLTMPIQSKLNSYLYSGGKEKVKFTDNALGVLQGRQNVGKQAADKIMKAHVGARSVKPENIVAMELKGRRLYNNTTQIAHMSGKEKSLLLQWLSHNKSKFKSIDDLDDDIIQYFKKLGYKGSELETKIVDAKNVLSITDGQLTMSFSPKGKPHYFTGGFHTTGRVSKPKLSLFKDDTVPEINWTSTDYHDLGGSLLDRATSTFMKKRVMPIYETNKRKAIPKGKFSKYFEKEVQTLKKERKKIGTVTKKESKVLDGIKKTPKEELNIKNISDKDLASISGASQADIKALREISSIYDEKELWSLAKVLGIGASIGTAGLGAGMYAFEEK